MKAIKLSSGVSLPISITLLFCGCLLYTVPLERSVVAGIYMFTMLLVAVIMLKTFDNLVFASRLLLLYVIGAYPLAVKLINENYYFSVYEFTTQSLEIATTMYALTLIAVPGCYLGWLLGQNIKTGPAAPPVYRNRAERSLYYCTIFYLCAGFAVFAGYIIIRESTGTILDGAYGTGTEGSPVLGSASAFGGVALSVMLYCALNLKKRVFYMVIVLVALYLFVWCQILRGLRQDVVSACLSLIVVYLLHTQGRVSFRLKYLLYTVPLVAALELWGLIRSGLHSWLAGEIDVTQVLDMGLGNAATLDDVIYSGTAGPIATTFANIAYLVKGNLMPLLYGQGYADYILRTPPAFLYPDRPKDYAGIFPSYNLSSGGGFFELAEAYLNFGAAGVFVMPLLVSAVIAFFYAQARKGNNIFYIFSLSSLMCVWLRGSWYQTFAFYKSFISGCILFLAATCLVTLVLGFYRVMQKQKRRSAAATPQVAVSGALAPH